MDLLGGVTDWKVQHWTMGEDGRFRVEGDVVVLCYQNKNYLLPVRKF
ncbi:MAG TPA: hypothetical protein VKX33_13665 [Cyclobacteriaceae bacterium]|nr:hypothetical protein [Cyclobacteriaceae bacterium]